MMARRRSCTHRATIGTITAATLAGAAVAAAVRLVSRVEVVGSSMAPVLLPGDRLVVFRWPAPLTAWPRPGEVVAVRDPRDPARVLVKRVGAVDRQRGSIEVLGDAAASTDSRAFGPVPRSLVVGRALYRYAPPGRVGGGPWPPGYDPSEGEPAARLRSGPTGAPSATKGTA